MCHLLVERELHRHIRQVKQTEKAVRTEIGIVPSVRH